MDAIVYHLPCKRCRASRWKPENQNKEKERMWLDKIELKDLLKNGGTFLHPTFQKSWFLLNNALLGVIK